MIDISKLTEADINRQVRYQAYGVTEWGKITSWNERFIFVRYHSRQVEGGDKHQRTGSKSEATSPRDLEFCE